MYLGMIALAPWLIGTLGSVAGLGAAIFLGALVYPLGIATLSPALTSQLTGLAKAVRGRDRRRLGELLGDTA